jgi:hypothetical protein
MRERRELFNPYDDEKIEADKKIKNYLAAQRNKKSLTSR